MLLYQTPDDTLVIETQDGTLWQPTGDAETPDLQFTSDLAEYGWEPSTGPRNGLTAVAERQPGRRLPRLLVDPEDLSDTAWKLLEAQDDYVSFYAIRQRRDGGWVTIRQWLSSGEIGQVDEVLREHLDQVDSRRRGHRSPDLDEIQVVTWNGRIPQVHTLTPEVVSRLLQKRVQAAARTLREAEDRLRRHAVRLVRQGVEPGEVVELFGDQVADAVDREVRAQAAETAVSEVLAEAEGPVTMRVERDRFGGDALNVIPPHPSIEDMLTGGLPSREEVAGFVDRVCAAIARKGLPVRVASDPHAGEWIVVSY
ncbi:MAG: hypothetical protein IRZ07_20500 [Microbispora sp.]|nr:hypothetical protein [Microbispora sp.]